MSWKSTSAKVVRDHSLDRLWASYRPEENHLSIELISVDPSARGRGHATRAMKDILRWSDEKGATVTLTPSSDFGSSKRKLEAWYRTLGFKPNKGRRRDYRFQDTMIREPAARENPTTGTNTMAIYDGHYMNPTPKKGKKMATTKKKAAKKKTAKKTTRRAAPRKAAKKKAAKKKTAKKKVAKRRSTSALERAARSAPRGVSLVRQETLKKGRAEAAKLKKKIATLQKSKTKSASRIATLEKDVRSLRARVGAARKRGDLTAAQEKTLKSELELCKARVDRCKSSAAAAKKKATKKKTAKKKVAKKKATKKRTARKTTKKKVAKKKVAKKKVAKKKVAKKKVAKKRTKVGTTRVNTKTASKRKKAAAKKPACKTKAKKKPVRCQTRPTQISLSACRRAHDSWQGSDKRSAKKKKSVRTTCGPGAPKKKAAGYLGGKQKGKTKGKPREVTTAEQKKIMARFMNLNT